MHSGSISSYTEVEIIVIICIKDKKLFYQYVHMLLRHLSMSLTAAQHSYNGQYNKDIRTKVPQVDYWLQGGFYFIL